MLARNSKAIAAALATLIATFAALVGIENLPDEPALAAGLATVIAAVVAVATWFSPRNED